MSRLFRFHSPGGPHGRSKLSTITDLVCVVVAIAALGIIVKGRSGTAANHQAPDVEAMAAIGGHPRPVVVTGGSRPGRRQVTFATGRPSLVLLFRTDCPACQANKAAWEDLVESVGNRVDVHAFSQEAITDSISIFHSPEIDVGFADSPSAMQAAFPFDYVPVTLIIAPDGHIQYSHVGVLRQIEIDSISTVIRSLRS